MEWVYQHGGCGKILCCCTWGIHNSVDDVTWLQVCMYIIKSNWKVFNLFIIFQVSGSASDLEDDLSAELDIVGRINPDTVWDYIGKMKRASNKDIVILRLQAANDEEKMQYIALYSYLSSRNRFVDCLNYSFNKIYYFPNNYYLNLFKFGFLFIYLYSFWHECLLYACL